MPMVHIPRRNSRFGGTVSVGVNGRISKVPVGEDYVASDGEYDALIAAGVPVQQMTIPAGMIAISPFIHGGRVSIAVNGVFTILPTGVAFVPTSGQIAALSAVGISYMGPLIPVSALTFSDNQPLQFSDGKYLELAA